MGRSHIHRIQATIALLSLFGCGSQTTGTAIVEGTVTKNGEPLKGIMVEFWPDAGGMRSFGETNSEGRFSLATYDGKKTGALLGLHRVVLIDSAVLGDKFLGREGESVDMTQGRKPRISGKYGFSETTPLFERVESGKRNQFDIEITD